MNNFKKSKQKEIDYFTTESLLDETYSSDQGY